MSETQLRPERACPPSGGERTVNNHSVPVSAVTEACPRSRASLQAAAGSTWGREKRLQRRRVQQVGLWKVHENAGRGVSGTGQVKMLKHECKGTWKRHRGGMTRKAWLNTLRKSGSNPKGMTKIFRQGCAGLGSMIQTDNSDHSVEGGLKERRQGNQVRRLMKSLHTRGKEPEFRSWLWDESKVKFGVGVGGSS